MAGPNSVLIVTLTGSMGLSLIAEQFSDQPTEHASIMLAFLFAREKQNHRHLTGWRCQNQSLYECQETWLAFRREQTYLILLSRKSHVSRPRIIFFQFKLFRLGARIFLSRKIASVSCAYQFDLKGRWLRHDTYSLMWCDKFTPYS